MSAFRGTESRMINVTSAPKFRNIFANSTAMIPDPVIAMDLGKKEMVFMESESNTRFPSNGIALGKNGFDPVAISMLCAVRVLRDAAEPLSFVSTNDCVGPRLSSGKEQYPVTSVTPDSDNCRRISSALLLAKSKHEFTISFHTESSRNPIPRNVETWIRLDVSRNALLYNPDGAPRLKSSLVIGFINAADANGASNNNTFLLNGACAAVSAATVPTTPAPITITSYISCSIFTSVLLLVAVLRRRLLLLLRLSLHSPILLCTRDIEYGDRIRFLVVWILW